MTQQPIAYACYRHPDRGTYIRCQRCGRPICGECMITAAVGFQCPDCVAQGARQTRQSQGPYGGGLSRNPTLTTMVLIGINVAVWTAILLTGGATSRLVDLLSLMPGGRCLSVSDPNSYYPGIGAAVCASSGDGLWSPGVASGALWQVLTSAFTQVEVLHIGMNMLSLWFLGPPLERAFGRVRFLAIYLLSAIAGSVGVLWLADPATQTLGASGAIFGLIGALLVLAHKVHGDVRTVLIWLGINLVFTFVGAGYISWQGHIGGLIGGLAAAIVVIYAPRENRSRVQLLGLVVLLAVLVVAIAVRVGQLT